MNYKMVFSTIGKVLLIEAILMCFPLAISFLYLEDALRSLMSFGIPILALILVGFPLSKLKSKTSSIFAKEGFIIVALVWIVVSLFGAIPFVMDGCIPNYIDAFFETVSGFTTTGASILQNVEALGYGLQFWRLFTHWIGGMGVLVFVLAILPKQEASAVHVFRAESPGPQVGKLVSKLRFTARILYLIYGTLTLLQIVLLLCGGMPIYDSVLYTFSTAGTGGFAIKSDFFNSYNNQVYIEMVIAVFMFLFSVNFNVFYLILIGKVKKAFAMEEVRAYFVIVVVATLAIALNILSSVSNFGEAIRYAFFQVTSISSTTGLTTTNFVEWPDFSLAVLLILTIFGACGGSTGGGVKISRLIILIKSGFRDVKNMVHPRAVVTIRLENEPITKEVDRNVKTYLVFWFLIVIICTLLLCVLNDGFGILTNLSASITCISNVGPGITQMIGPIGNFALYSPVSKILLSAVMLFGRLEIFPMLILFIPRTWKKG